jgi:hypothetical protein
VLFGFLFQMPFICRRNQLGQLGFHVQHDGLITEVENFGYAWQTGLRQVKAVIPFVCYHVMTTFAIVSCTRVVHPSLFHSKLFFFRSLTIIHILPIPLHRTAFQFFIFGFIKLLS